MEEKTHNPITIANYFIGLSRQKGGLTLLQLLKLSYIAHGFKLAFFENPLANEYAEAWKYGPVFPSIYHEFKANIGPITKKANTFDMTKQELIVWESNFTNNETKLMDRVYQSYGSLEGWQLSSLTHAPNTPWAEAWKEGEHIRGFSISNDKIKEYYKDLIQRFKNGQ